MIKIDRSFVLSLAERDDASRGSAVIEAILALGNSLGIEILAEGIETELQRETLLRMGCSFAQGYLFGRPAAAAYWLAVEDVAGGGLPTPGHAEQVAGS
jgi:EAL domain-containing protein (putative c-di-GMP-specific phosphodiesterase class I)